MKRNALLCAIFLGHLAAAASAEAPELGMTAPPLQVAEWVKGEPADLESLKGKAVVVEFWATWCPPCRTSIPHLTQLQKKYGNDLAILGVTSEAASVVQPFVEKMGDQMDYRVAVDQNDGTAQAYMAAFGQNGIPYAFLVDHTGKLVWHDSPLSPDFEKAVDQLVEKRFDAKVFQEMQVQRDKSIEQANAYIARLAEGEDSEEVRQLGKDVLKSLQEEPMMLSQIALVIATGELKARPWDIAQQAADTAVKLTEGRDSMALTAQAHVLQGQGKLQEAIEVQEKAVAQAEDPREKQVLQRTYDDMVASQAPVAQ